MTNDNKALTFESKLEKEFIFPRFCVEIPGSSDYKVIILALLEAGYGWRGDYLSAKNGMQRCPDFPTLVVDVIKKELQRVPELSIVLRLMNIKEIDIGREMPVKDMLNAIANARAAVSADKRTVAPVKIDVKPANILIRPKI